MDALYEKNPFVNPSGGVWTQGFEITYGPRDWDEQPLRVWLVPHSHNDPGSLLPSALPPRI